MSYKYSDHVLELNPELAAKHRGKRQNRTKGPKAPTALESTFDAVWGLLGGPELIIDYVGWHPTRNWEIDRYHAASKVGIEINGGTAMRISGHNSVKGIHRDYQKLLACTEHGIRLVFIDTIMLSEANQCETVEQIMRIINDE